MHNISWHYHDVSSSRIDGNDYASPWSHGSSNTGGVKKKFLEEFVVSGDEITKWRIGRTRRKREIKDSDDGSGSINKDGSSENISYSGAMNDMATNIRGHANELHAKNINNKKSDIFGMNSDSDTTINTANESKRQTYQLESPEKNNNNNNDIAYPNTPDEAATKDTPHPVSGLNCADHGGPTNPKIIEEMIFWSDIPSDSDYVSPMYDPNAKEEKYLTFEPDQGGWNNIRMAMETALLMSHAMGRTLVLPPEQRMYLIDKMNGEQKTMFGFQDFFHLDAISIEHKGFKILRTEEFLEKEGVTGGLKNKETGSVMFPPKNRTNWDGPDRQTLFQYLREVGMTPEWESWDCALAIPQSRDDEAIDDLNNTLHSIMDGSYGKPVPTVEEFTGNPTPVNASMAERMREMLADRKELCIYDKPLQNSKLIHLKVHNGVRLLTHFYAFIFFADWKQDLWSKRFVRDHLRYVDEIICAAARVVEAVREHAILKNATNTEGIYDAMHVRRGDFQFSPTQLPADELYDLSKGNLEQGSTLYVATDEKNKTFFEPLKKHYDVVFLDDFLHVLPGVNTNYYGMIDQLVCYKSRIFYGTWWSTLSGYVNRMKGYYTAKHELEGYKDGTLRSFYFTPPERVLQMRSYIPVRKPIYMREFPISWRDIDQGIEDIASQKI